ncbi:MAG: ArnT family glycosyltransferase [Halobellus sp.]
MSRGVTARARDRLGRLRDAARAHPERVVAAALAVGVGLLIYYLAIDLFPYHSVNDDEGVYLYQAAMLLEGKLFLRPGDIPWEAVRPWFFVVDGTESGVRMYSKYSPVAPAVFAVGRLLGDWNVALGLVATGTAAGVYWLGAAAFGRRVGLVAVPALAAAPLFLMTSATFLSYAPATMLNVAFAVAYVKSARAGSRRWGVAAGTAIGLAFFCRPYTAVLFALPFIAHTLLSLGVAWRRVGWAPDFRGILGRALAVALPGAAFVGLTLAYNAVTTGDPLVFPYQAFAPNDGIGFGPHEILNYERNYTPELAYETTVTITEYFFTEWVAAGTLGTAVALVGVAGAVWRARGVDLRERFAPAAGMGDGEVRAVLFAIVPSVFLGEAYFWGTHNGLRNGLIDLLGPFYHFDALVPVAVFTAAGAAFLVRGAVRALRSVTTRRRARLVVVVALVAAAPVVASAERSVVADPLAANELRTENLAATYEPFEERSFDDALVFTPDPYGDWQAHPFQYLRYDPGYDGDVVYATDGGPDRDLRVLNATDRTPYRFTYRGVWTGAATPVNPELTRLRVVEAEAVRARTTVGVPAQATSASVRIETPEGYARYAVPANATDDGAVTVEWTVGPETARVTNFPYAGGSRFRDVPLAEARAEADLAVTFVGIGGSSVTYRQEVTLDARGDSVRVVWPPETRVCRLTTECGREGTWVGPDGDYVRGVSVRMNATAVRNRSAGAAASLRRRPPPSVTRPPTDR